MRSNFTTAPPGWESPTEKYELAVVRTFEALRHPRAGDRVARYYALNGNFAGATFPELQPTDVSGIAASDLLAITLLDVQAPPAAVRRILEPGPVRDQLTELLSEPHLGVDANLAVACKETLVAMAALHQQFKKGLAAAGVNHSNRWVTASKLCARKRPDLFPVRDLVVCDYLGLTKPKHNYEVDWQVFRHLTQHEEIRRELDDVVGQAGRRPGVYCGSPERRLRHLDVVLWMHARSA